MGHGVQCVKVICLLYVNVVHCFLVTASTVASWLLLLPAPGLCQCSWLLRTTHRSESGSQRLSAVLCSVTIQSKSLWWGHESFQSDRWHCVSWSGVDGLLLKNFVMCLNYLTRWFPLLLQYGHHFLSMPNSFSMVAHRNTFPAFDQFRSRSQ